MKKNSVNTKVAFTHKRAGAEETRAEAANNEASAVANEFSTIQGNEDKSQVLTSLFNAIDIPVCIINEHFYFADVNDAFCKAFGYTKSEIVLTDASLILTTGNVSSWPKDDSETNVVWTGTHKSGAQQLYAAGIKPLTGNAGIQYTVVTLQHVPHDKKNQPETRAENNKYKLIVENSLTAFFLTRPDGKILEANNAACDMFGYSVAEFKHLGRQGILDRTDDNYNRYLKRRKDEGSINGALTAIKKSGEHFTVECSSVLFNDDGQQYATVSMIDISKSINLYRDNLLLINNTEESFVVVSKDLAIISFNKKFETNCRLFLMKHVKAGDIILSYSPASHLPELKDIYQKVFAGEKITCTLSYQANGITYSVRHHFKPLQDEHGHITAAFITSADITEKEKALQLLISNKKRYKALIDNSHEAVAILSPEGALLYVSEAVKKVLGYSAEEMLQLSPMEMVHPDDVENLKKNWQELLGGKHSFLQNFLCRMQHKDGTWKWTESTFNNLLQNESVQGIVNNFRDVSESVASIEKVKQSEENLKAIFENPDEGFVLIGPDFTVKACNNIARYSVFTGIEMRIGDNIFNFVEENRKEFFKDILTKTFTGISSNYDLPTSNKKTGQKLWVNISINPVKENNTIVAVCLTGRDITKQKDNDIKITQAENLLKRAESIANVGSIEIDYVLNKRVWSDGFFRILDLEPGSMECTSDNFIRFLHPEDKADYLIALGKQLEERLHYGQVETRIITVSGTEKNIKAYAQAEYADDGTPLKLVGVLHDITRQKIEEKQKSSIKRLLNNAESLAKIGSAEINIVTGKRVWSNEFYRIIGLKPGSIEPSKEGIIQFLHPDEKQTYIQWLQNGLANKTEAQQLETRLITAKGEVRNIMAYGSTKYNADGKPDALTGVIQDITDRKKMELDLQRSQEMYESLFYQNPAAVFSMDLDGKITTANHILALKAECSEDEVLAMHYTDFIFPEDLPLVKSYFENTKSGQSQEHEIRIITAKGNILFVSMVSLPIMINNSITGVYCIATDITKEKNALKLLNKTLADRQRILDSSFDMICEIDAAGKFIQVSKACFQMLGYQPEELIGQHYTDFIADEDKERCLEIENGSKEDFNQVKNFENTFIRKDGKPVNLSWASRWDSHEKTMYCIAKDATEKKAQEQALGLSEQRYQNLFNNNPLPLFIFDFETRRIVEANQSAFEKYGYSKQEFLSLSVDDLRPPSERLILDGMLKDEEAFSHINERVWTHQKKNGELMYMKRNGNIIDYNGKKSVLSLLDDVTEKIKIDEAIRESEEKRRLIMNAALDAIVCMDTEGRVIFWNPQAEKIFGWKEAEVIGLQVSNLIVPERYRKLHHSGMRTYLQTGHGPALNNMLSLAAITKDQKEFPIEMTVQSIKQKDDEFFCAFIRDVTEQRKAASLKNFERRDKEALINSTDDLIWSVSKDLKLIAGNNAFIKNYKAQTGITIRPGDYLLKKDVFTEDMLLIWHEMYYTALAGETIKKEIGSNKPLQTIPEWNEVSFNPIYNGKEISGIACYSRNITENKLQNDRLLVTNKKLETAQQMAKLGYWQVDLKTNTAFWSDELYRIHGFAKTGLPVPFQQIVSAIHPDDVKTVMQCFTEAMEGKRPYEYEHRIVLDDGTIKMLLQKGTLLYNKKGEPYAIEGTTQDITLLKMAEQAVKDSEEKYRMIFNCNPLPNWIYDLETLQIIEVNDAAIAHYGYSSNEFLEMTIKELFIPDQVAAVIHANQEINNYGLINFGQWQHIKKSGALIDVDITGHSIFYSNRNAVMIVSNDITEIIQSQQALIKSIERFEYATKATSDAIWDCDLANDSVFWGEGFNTLFGYKIKDPKPGLKSWEGLIHPDDQANAIKSINDVIEDKTKTYWQGEYRFKKFDGSYTTVSDCALIIRDKNGTPYRIIGAMQDITKRIQNEIMLKQLNEQLNKRAAELAASNAELEQFAYIASHDLQEPLRMVTSFLNQIQKKYQAQLDDNGRTYIHFAVDGAVRMRQIIQDLLEYSRVGWQKYHFEKIDLNNLLDEVSGIYKNTTGEKKIKITWNKMPEILAAKIPVHQLFQNLIGNAIKYQHPENSPEISISATEFDQHWQFAVADNGIGIDKEYFERVFVIFQRLHNKNEFSGTGIGLAICKKIVDNHNGKIWVESAKDKGSTFYFTIPKQLENKLPAIIQ